MSEIIQSPQCVILPSPRVPISIRPAVMEDLPFIDSLQKKHTKQVGWMPTKQFEGKIKAGHVIVAEERSEIRDQMSENACLTSDLRPLTSAPVGYLIGNDQYFKRDDVGIIYQINIAEGKRRALVGATLLKAQFERSAYGCRLYCCWCAQDIEANRFWESMGFVPLAFRTGSAAKSRVHIFWQRRIRAGDETTPYWFPAQTNSGSIREDRLVLPIPPGTHWSDEMPRILPREESTKLEAPNHKQIATIRERVPRSKIQNGKPVMALGRLCFTLPKPVIEKPKREKRAKVKNDPKLVAAARELRDRWLEQVNSGQYLPAAEGKYQITRALPGDRTPVSIAEIKSSLALPAPLAA